MARRAAGAVAARVTGMALLFERHVAGMLVADGDGPEVDRVGRGRHRGGAMVP